MVLADGIYSVIKLVYTLVKDAMNRDAANSGEDEESDPTGAAREQRLVELFMDSKFPSWMIIGGYCCSAAVAMVLLDSVFSMAWWMVLVGVLITPVLAVAIIVGVGMTDWDVSANFGKLMMLLFGAMTHSTGSTSLIPTLAGCMLTISGCGAAAGLMQDFKTGYLMGTKPKIMFVAQMVGAIAGCFIAPAVFQLFNNAYTLPGPPTQTLQGIYGTSYRVLAEVFTDGGFSQFPTNSLLFCAVAFALAIILDVSIDMVPERVQDYIPNPMAMSIGLMMGPGVGVDFMLGGLAISLWRAKDPHGCKKFSVVVACGCLAGGAIAQLVIILLQSCGVSPVAWPVWPVGWGGER